jgi:hypothetical protein
MLVDDRGTRDVPLGQVGLLGDPKCPSFGLQSRMIMILLVVEENTFG